METSIKDTFLLAKKMDELKKEQFDQLLISEKKPLSEWCNILSLEQFNHALSKIWEQRTLIEDGTNYFTRGSKDFNDEFNIWCEEVGLSDEKFYCIFDGYPNPDENPSFFDINLNIYQSSMSRSVVKSESVNLVGDEIIYDYSKTSYDGFGSRLFEQTYKLTYCTIKNRFTKKFDSNDRTRLMYDNPYINKYYIAGQIYMNNHIVNRSVKY